MKRFIKNPSAATAIEFAIVLPVLLLLLLGITQFGLTLFFDSSLNTGIRTVARQGVGGGITKNEINQTMIDNLGGLYDPNQAQFVMLSFSNFTDQAFVDAKNQFLSNPDVFFDATSTAGNIIIPAKQSGQIILYGVKYPWGQTFGITNPFLPTSLYSFSIVRDEAYNATPPAGP